MDFTEALPAIIYAYYQAIFIACVAALADDSDTRFDGIIGVWLLLIPLLILFKFALFNQDASYEGLAEFLALIIITPAILILACTLGIVYFKKPNNKLILPLHNKCRCIRL